MFLISWNVAGLSTTLNKIDKDYAHASSSNTTSTSSAKPNRTHAFSHYLKLHGDPDILCIQEHKIPLSQLSSRSEALGCSSIEGYESFWSCCVDKSKKGFNGVVTFCKIGICQSANSRPLKSDDLDDQGRVVMTDHGQFVVFNVYAPASCGMPLSYKMKFLNALNRAMKEQREKGKRVILVGDLNIAHTGLDITWNDRHVLIDSIKEQVRNRDSLCESLPQWKLEVAQHWDEIERVLENTLKVVPVTRQNVSTGAKFDKFQACVTVNRSGNERKIYLGNAETSEEACLYTYKFEEAVYHDHDLDKECIAREKNKICLGTLTELMAKVVGVQWDTKTIEMIANTDGLKKSSPAVDWLDGVIQQDKMVDAFRHLYPNAKGRYTCWCQRTNRRQENDGLRIDYTLLDQELVQYIQSDGSQKLRCCNYANADTMFGSEEAALHAATASGQFRGAGYEGGGIADATQQALATQFGDIHTGIIYTAPQYSVSEF